MALIYSNYLETVIPKGFIWHGQTWMWNEADLMYYNVEDDEAVDYDYDSAMKRIALGQFKPL